MAVKETALDIGRKKWTRDECRQLLEVGILEEGRFELIGGDVVPKMTQHERHINTCKQIQKALEAVFSTDHVRLAAPLALGEYEEPEPDAAVMHRPLIEYLRLGTPLPAEVRLAVEVSDRTLHVFRQPTEAGYASETLLTPDEALSPLAAPDAFLAVADVLP